MARVLQAICLSTVISIASSHMRCGIDDPLVFGPSLREGIPLTTPIVAQTYETPELREQTARRLNTQAYTDSGTFIPIADADAAGWVKPLRVTVVWDVIDTLDATGTAAQRRMCTTIGEIIEVKNGGWVVWNTANFPGTSPCNDKTVLTGSTAASNRYAVIKKRTAEAVNYWQSTVRVKKTQDNIVLDSSISTEFGLAAGTSYGNTDLVLIMTARPSPASPIAGFAVCYQRDQRGRCTVGHFNWVPEIIDVDNSLVPDTIESEMHTALHELMHVLGGMSPGASVASSPFIDDAGVTRNTGVFLVENDPAYPTASGKKRTLIITKRVANFTQKYFNCATAQGLALEDVPLGKGSHWEARLMGPELMSYGSGSGQVYISDATLGFLEDTNQYLVDYSKAGPIVSIAEEDDFASMKSLSFLRTNEAPSDYTPPAPPPVGAMRWGNNGGCKFLDEHPSTSWPSEYLCQENRKYGCTPDHRMSAVCIVKADYIASEQSCGEYKQDGTGANNCIQASTGGVPTYMQYFTTDAAATAASGIVGATAGSTGGYNNAMDYTPVMVGYWNCMYANPKSNSSTTLGGGDTGSKLKEFVSSFGSAPDMQTFGGQARCPNCRCLTSSLMELTKGYVPNAPSYGLCYRVNCYRPDYLQIAVKSSVSISDSSFWYACPAAGGKLYIPGFTGSVMCPNVVSFCANEEISGIRYPEQNRVVEAIFWGGICAFAFFMMIVCGMPCLRDRMINCTKGCCGARVFEIVQDKSEDGSPLPLPKIPANILLGVNVLTLLAGLGLVGGSSYIIYMGQSSAQIMPLLSMGILSSMLSGIGLRGSCKRAEHGPSCYLLTYFFADVLLLTLMLWTIIYSFAFTSWSSIAETRYDTLVKYFPISATNTTREQNIDYFREKLEANQWKIAGVFIGILLTFLTTLVAAGRMINGRTLITIFITFVNNIMLAFGVIMMIVGLYFVAFKASVVAGAMAVVAIVIVAGVFFIVIGSVGHASVFKHQRKVMYVYMGFQVLLALLALAAIVISFNSTTDVGKYVSKLDDKALGEVSSALGMPLTSDQIVDKIQNNLHQLGLSFCMVLILQIMLFVNTLLFMKALKTHKLVSSSSSSSSSTSPSSGGKPSGPIILMDNNHFAKVPRAAHHTVGRGQRV